MCERVLEKPSGSSITDAIKMKPLDFDSFRSCVLEQADCSMRKTSVGMNSPINYHRELNHSILLVTENSALSFHL